MIEETEEIMDDEDIVKDYKTSLIAFLNKFPEAVKLWGKIKYDILPSLYANMHNNRLFYYIDFRVLDNSLYCGIFKTGYGNLKSSPNKAKIKAYIGDVTNWDSDVVSLLVQYIIAQLIYDQQIIVTGYGDVRDSMINIMKLIQDNPIFNMNGYAWETFRQVQVSFYIGTHD